MNNGEILKLFTSNIKRIRLARGFTKRQVAERVGLNYSNYCRIENGKVTPRFTTALYIAEALGANWEDLFKGCH